MSATPTSAPTSQEVIAAQALIEQAQKLLAEAARLDPSAAIPGAGAQGETAPPPPPAPRTREHVLHDILGTVAGLLGNHPTLDTLITELKALK